MSGESLGSIAAVPGLRDQTPEFHRRLLALAKKNGWDVDAIAAIISQESRFNPQAKNPKGSAYGLIQWIDSVKRAMGTSQAELEKMNAEEQLQFVERYFQMSLGGRIPPRPGDYYLTTYGRTDAIGKPDSFVLDRADSTDPQEKRRYDWNKALDRDKDGAITAGDIRSVPERLLAGVHERVYVFESELEKSGPKMLLMLGTMLVVGYIFFNTVLPAPKKRGALA